MEKMKHQDGFAPSVEDTSKLNKIVTWLTDHGFHGILLIHKDNVGVSWMNEESADKIRHDFINALGHIAKESPDSAVALVRGMAMALNQIEE